VTLESVEEELLASEGVLDLLEETQKALSRTRLPLVDKQAGVQCPLLLR